MSDDAKPTPDVRAIPEEMLRFFDYQPDEGFQSETGEKLAEHYRRGDGPARAVRKSFSDRKLASELRGSLALMNGLLCRTLEDCDDPDAKLLHHRLPVRDMKWPSKLQTTLNRKGIVLQPQDHRFRDCPQLSKEQFHRQAVGLVYAIAEYGTEQLMKKKVRDLAQAVAGYQPELLADIPGVTIGVQRQQHCKGYLRCDLPPGYFDLREEQMAWLESQSEHLKCDLPPAYIGWLEKRADWFKG
ncbi:hypothetical protein [Adonisia turfae]|uniref:Uncharacterized protein n=1 Tax=Adonisia turfae CCMR0081 TaxID=2292702 RepID=A0A6M0RXX1_9CYAN|nr:hypothetical protein [Adonisia turfae]NEZ61049.1 hypothetical protein [Adonisia turfae CCMR0081]